MTEQRKGVPRRRVLHLTDEELAALQLPADRIDAADAGHHHHDDESVVEPDPPETVDV
jgi:hypothetical protein